MVKTLQSETATFRQLIEKEPMTLRRTLENLSELLEQAAIKLREAAEVLRDPIETPELTEPQEQVVSRSPSHA